MCTCVYTWMCAPECGACGGQRRTTGTLNQELQVVVSL